MRACFRSRSNMDAMTLFSVLMVSRALEDSFSTRETRTKAPLLTVFPANLQDTHRKVFHLIIIETALS